MAMLFLLQALEPVEVTCDSRQRWISARKMFFISRQRDGIPEVLQCRYGDRAFGVKEMVETSLPDAGTCAKSRPR